MPRPNDAAPSLDSDGVAEVGGNEQEAGPRKLFISYAREDKAIARTVAEVLASHGYHIFWDVKIPTGEKFDTYLFRKLNESDAVVVLWSVHSVQSDYVKEEAEFGKIHTALVPLRIDQTPLPFGFTRIQTTDIGDWSRSARAPGWQLVVDSIESALGGQTIYNSYGPESGFVTKPVAKKHGLHLSPRALIAIAVVAVALLGLFVIEQQSEGTTNQNDEASPQRTQNPTTVVATSGDEQVQGTEHPVAQQGASDTLAAHQEASATLAAQQDPSAALQELVAEPTAVESKPARAPIAARRPADLTVFVFPWGEVWINGEAKGSAPLKNQSLKPGRYKVSAGQGTAAKTRVVRLAPGEEKTLRFDLMK